MVQAALGRQASPTRLNTMLSKFSRVGDAGQIVPQSEAVEVSRRIDTAGLDVSAGRLGICLLNGGKTEIDTEAPMPIV